MTLLEVRNNVLRVLWVEYPTLCPDYIYEDVTTAINSAFQLIWTSPHAYFRQNEFTATVPSGGSVDLPDSIQEVQTPLWIAAENNRELHRILDQSEFNQFYQRFHGKNEAEAVAAGTAAASYYFIKTRNQSGEDNTRVTLMVTPKPLVDVDVTYLATTEAPNYTVSEIKTLTSSTTVGMPHKYVESTLLPIARFFAMRSHFFFEKDKAGMISSDVARASAFIGVSNPDAGTENSDPAQA